LVAQATRLPRKKRGNNPDPAATTVSLPSNPGIKGKLRYGGGSANINVTTQSCKPLPAMLDDHTITTVCKVIGGLSADNFRLDFDTGSKACASFQLLSGGQSLTFIETIIAD